MTSDSTGSEISTPRRNRDRPAPGLWERISFPIAHAVASWLLLCLSLKGLYRFGRLFGTLEWLINFKRRRRFGAALERALGYKPAARVRRRETREFFMRARCDKLLYLVLDRIPRDKAMALLSVGNSQMLADAVARGHGVYVALAHHGAHHVIALLMTLNGYKTAGVRDRREGGLRRYMQSRFRRRYPEFQQLRMLFADAYPRDIYRCLREGYLLGSAIDVSRTREPNQKTTKVTIFGKKREFLSGPLRIAIRCRAPVLQAFIVPQESFRYRLDIVDMLIDPETVEDETDAVAKAVRTYAANVERYVRESPSLLTRI